MWYMFIEAWDNELNFFFFQFLYEKSFIVFIVEPFLCHRHILYSCAIYILINIIILPVHLPCCRNKIEDFLSVPSPAPSIDASGHSVSPFLVTDSIHKTYSCSDTNGQVVKMLINIFYEDYYLQFNYDFIKSC